MLPLIILPMLMVAIGVPGASPSLAGLAAPHQFKHNTCSVWTRNGICQFDREGPPIFDSYRFLVQRESSRPPTESRTGRASGGPPSEITDMKRDSTQPSDILEDRSKQSIVNETEKGLPNSVLAPKKSHDPTEGGGETPSSFSRRGGVRQ